MAVTNIKRQEELANGTQKVQSTSPYQGLAGVSGNTAANLGNYQQGYQQSDAVTNAQNTLQQVQNSKPQSYASKYSTALDNIMQQIQNPGQFKYEFNGDNLFKNYADLYTQKGKQASLDAMGQAAALTGGYGNSYAQGVGQQAYQQYLLSLYDKGLDMYDRAYQRYNDQLGNNKDIYNMLAAQESQDYNRYRDTVGDWQTEEQQAYNRAQDAAQADYDAYKDALNYYTNLAQAENKQYNTDAERNEAIRQYEQDFAEKQRQYDENMALDRENAQWKRDTDARDYAESVRQYNENLAMDKENAQWKRDTDARDFAEQQRLADIENALNQDKFDWQKEADARDFEEEKRQYEQGLAYKYVQAVLAQKQMPSDELLAAAGLSRADAQKMLGQVTGGGGGGYSGSGKAPSGSGNGKTVYVDYANGKEQYVTFGDDGHLRWATDDEIKNGTIDTKLLDSGAQNVLSQALNKPTTLLANTTPAGAVGSGYVNSVNNALNKALNNVVIAGGNATDSKKKK